MKKKYLMMPELQDIDSRESMQITGGWILAAIGIATAVIYLYNEGNDFVEGFKEGYNS